MYSAHPHYILCFHSYSLIMLVFHVYLLYYESNLSPPYHMYMHMCVCVCACVPACVRACVHACVSACLRVCVCEHQCCGTYVQFISNQLPLQLLGYFKNRLPLPLQSLSIYYKLQFLLYVIVMYHIVGQN